MAASASTIAADNAKSINAAQGKEVHLSLESNPSKGYGWMIKNLPEQLIFVATVHEQCHEV